ncbi:MAG: hypothetical protein V2B18_11205 [Pseudomonadota bacterium]
MKNPCFQHPDRDGPYYCRKDDKYLCEECACCHSPRIYCQFRTSCMIQFLTKEGELTPCEEKSAARGR